MDLLTIFLIAIGLSLDAFAVSIAAGAVMKYFNSGDAIKMAFFFGAFQLVMPVVGWLSGLTLTDFITGVDHWVAFGLLFLIGCKMIYESFKIDKMEKPGVNTMALLGLALATSIDALTVGLSLSFLKIAIAMPAIIIGIVTFSFSFLGVFIGHKFGRLFAGKIEVAGGIVIVGIGLKILFVN